MIQKHYSPEDYEQMADQLVTLHNATMQILEGATSADFESIKQAQIDTHRAVEILKALNTKKIKREENMHLQFLEGVRRR